MTLFLVWEFADVLRWQVQAGFIRINLETKFLIAPKKKKWRNCPHRVSGLMPRRPKKHPSGPPFEKKLICHELLVEGEIFPTSSI